MRKRFAFGSFWLDTGRETLYEHGVPVAIGRKAYSLLRALVEAGGEVVPKADLMDAAWPNLSVEEGNLSVQIAALRRRLGASPEGEDWIATFPRVGYRFVGPVEAANVPPPTDPHSVPQSRVTERPGFNIEAYDLYVRGRSLCLQSPSGNKLARSYLIKAIGLEPGFARAYSCLAVTYSGAATNYGEAVEENLALGLACAQTAISVDPDNPEARWALGYVRLSGGEPEEAQSEWETALGDGTTGRTRSRRQPRQAGRHQCDAWTPRGSDRVGGEGAPPQPLSAGRILLGSRFRLLRRRPVCRRSTCSAQTGAGPVAGKAHSRREPGATRALDGSPA